MVKAKRVIHRLSIPVIKGKILGVHVLRGYAKLSDLARISRPDIYDQRLNPTGTQRDLSPKHAKEAYEYVASHDLAFWPEVFLCVRDKNVMALESVDSERGFCVLKISDRIIERSSRICISRVDGNHRLHYADGATEGFKKLDEPVSFCIAYDLTLEQEIILFRDINNNQRRMNTSHLDKIEIRLTDEAKLKTKNPALFIAERLASDSSSPFSRLIYEGGRKLAPAFIPLRTLHSGISYMLSQSRKLPALADAEAQYRVISNFFSAVKEWQPEAWKHPKDYLLLRGAGLWGICFVGAEIIDRALGQGKFGKKDLLKILSSGSEWDWSNKGDFQGYSGRGGAVRIRDEIIGDVEDDEGVSIKRLFSEIMRD